MEKEQRVYAYFDGSNFYHLLKLNYSLSNIDFSKVSQDMLQKNEILGKVKYYNSPVNQQEEPEIYSKQLKFFEKIKNSPLLELRLGRLVKRKIGKINIVCPECGLQIAKSVNCPKCGKLINLENISKTSDKGLDVKIAIDLLLDAIDGKYDTALLFSGDADFSPAIEYIINNLKKKIVYCRFPKPKTNELIKVCSSTR